ncbi:MAG: hypothetical protein DRR08_12010 [Candidatus Parabeggiatoa sp. nov. 2]|nr:MAG: hypothetical protein DRR08_12010 [Gammaproteobacteria bacterium]
MLPLSSSPPPPPALPLPTINRNPATTIIIQTNVGTFVKRYKIPPLITSMNPLIRSINPIFMISPFLK